MSGKFVFYKSSPDRLNRQSDSAVDIYGTTQQSATGTDRPLLHVNQRTCSVYQHKHVLECLLGRLQPGRSSKSTYMVRAVTMKVGEIESIKVES